jgi:glycosyltransferase involved in cell wall biosynthesis
MKKIIIITARSGFPNGYGAASIIRKYSKGFLKCGYSPLVLLLRPSESSSGDGVFNRNIKGVYEGVEYEYMSNTCFTSKSLIVRFWRYCVALLRSIKFIVCRYKEIEKVFFYSPDFLISTIIIQVTCKLLNIKCVGIKTESSYSDRQRTKRLFWKVREKVLYRLFSSMVVITNYLKEQLSSFGYHKNILVLPIVVDEAMFDSVYCSNKETSLIYMGTLNYIEELICLIEAYNIVHKKYKSWKLHIIGGFVCVKTENMIKNLISGLDLTESIVWHGKIAASEVPEQLSRGGVMLLPRIAGEYSKAGFPIKLGEYLLSGSPTIVTRTGDIEDYLTDGVNAFLVAPNSSELFAERIEDVIKNYEKSLMVGIRGRTFAAEKFGSKNICKKMLES